MEQIVASKMMENLQLSQSEAAELRSFDRPVSSDFFSALHKAQQIHQQCKVLLQSGHQPTAFEIMEQMASLQETALEKLYRWTQAQCRNVESQEANMLLAQAVAGLQDRPVLLK